MKKDEKAIKEYETALKIAINEGNIFWQSSHVFLISSTIIASVITGFIFTSGVNFPMNDLRLFIVSLLGVLIDGIWFISYQRRSSYYQFRMAQVRKVEPGGWDLIGGNGKFFSDGAEVSVNGKSYRLPRPARFFNTEEIHRFLIIIFLIGYVTAIYFSGPWN